MAWTKVVLLLLLLAAQHAARMCCFEELVKENLRGSSWPNRNDPLSTAQQRTARQLASV